MEQKMQEKWYLLLDSKDTVLARGCLENSLDEINMQVRVADGKVSKVLEHEDIQMIAVSEDLPNLLGRIILRRGDVLVLDKLKALGAEIRQNLRMPARFESFIYPLTGAWKGRRTVRANDLSCGGIAFYCEEDLADGEQMEIVIPVTAEPLVLRCEVIRRRLSSGVPLYAAKFVDMCDEEERLVRGAVFSIQIENHAQSGLRKK